MTPGLTWRLIVKELRLGPRSPVFMFAIFMPVLMTFLISGVFGSLFEPEPRLGVVDLGSSAVMPSIESLEGLAVTVYDDTDDLLPRVESHDLDAGLVLPKGFDEALASRSKGGAELFVSGSSLASTRVVVVTAVTEAIGESAGIGSDVTVVVTSVGDEGVPLASRLVPMMVMYALVIAGLFLPAASLLEEREHRTLDALLVTPVQMGDVLVAKAAVAALVSTLMALVTLALNDAFGGRALLLGAILLVGSVMLAELGLVLGLWAKDANTLFTTIKGGGILIFLPVIFTIWPGLPQWIPRFTPTFYFLDPIYQVGVLGADVGDVIVDIGIAVAIVVALVPLVMAYGRRTEQRLASLV